MYYPIIRGRQYDLLAIRELKISDRLSNKVKPVIEPIKFSSTLLSTINEFTKSNHELIIVSNPKVGSFLVELDIDDTRSKFIEMCKQDNVNVGYYLNKNSDNEIPNLLAEYGLELTDFVILHHERNNLSIYNNFYTNITPKLNLIPLDTTFRRHLKGQNIVGVDDKFNKLLRNADYKDNEIESFSEEHLYYLEDGYIGFSDYSVVGADYNEGGFAPYAVAIHIVYPNENKALEIIHFVSDSNNDTSDPAGKFFEALEKLIDWYQAHKENVLMDTIAMRTFQQHYEQGTYPGLPTLKKLSIMHHLELVGNILEEE